MQEFIQANLLLKVWNLAKSLLASHTFFRKEEENDRRSVIRQGFFHSPVLVLSDEVTSLKAQDPGEKLLPTPSLSLIFQHGPTLYPLEVMEVSFS